MTTAEKQKGRGYSENSRVASFVGAFPMNDPRYAFLIMVDEPKPNEHSHGYATGGWVAAPAVHNIVERVAPDPVAQIVQRRDSLALILDLLERGVPCERIQLWQFGRIRRSGDRYLGPRHGGRQPDQRHDRFAAGHGSVLRHKEPLRLGKS